MSNDSGRRRRGASALALSELRHDYPEYDYGEVQWPYPRESESSVPFLENQFGEVQLPYPGPEYDYGEVPIDLSALTLSTSQLPYPNPREMCLPSLASSSSALSGSQLPYPKPLDISAAHMPNPRELPWMVNPPDDDYDSDLDTPEYEALCIADRERAESEIVGPRNLHREMPYSIDKLARPVGWDTSPKPTLENISPLWYDPPLSGLICSICGSSEHNEGVCPYLSEFPPDGRLLNNDVYEVVCLCGRAIVQGRCPGSCFSDRPMRVAAKICEPFWRFGRKHLSLKELTPRSPMSIHHLPPVSSREKPMSWVEFYDKFNNQELIPMPWEKDYFEALRDAKGDVMG